MTSNYKNVLCVGYGNMGKAIIDSLVDSVQIEQITVISPNLVSEEKGEKMVLRKSLAELNAGYSPDLLLFAVKPQIIADIIEDYQDVINEDTIICSILAGKDINFFTKYFPKNKILRIMPNLAALQKESANFLIEKGLNAKEKQEIDNLLQSFGKNFWLENEQMMHSATAVAGSGPAYYFSFLEIFSSYLIEQGFDANTSKEIALQTAKGSIAVAEENMDFTNLKNSVTSKGGTTAAAREVFETGDSLKNLLYQALEAASNKSKTL